jgi:Holliday junction DNA helicase RuvA
VMVALVGLGWNERAASQAVDEALAGATAAERETMPTLLRLALTRLGPSQFAGSSGSAGGAS